MLLCLKSAHIHLPIKTGRVRRVAVKDEVKCVIRSTIPDAGEPNTKITAYAQTCVSASNEPIIIVVQKRHKFSCRFQLSTGVGMTVPFSGGIGWKVVICVNNMLNGSVVPSVVVIRRCQDVIIVKYGNILKSSC